MSVTAKYCQNCDKLLNIDKYHCAVCYSEDLEIKELNGSGEVYSYTNIYAAPKRFAEIAPYHIILVDLEEGLRITARYNGDGDKLGIGKKVEFEKTQDRAYIFKPVVG